jgi:unsaturated chondroitin disaccharide hydrolase
MVLRPLLLGVLWAGLLVAPAGCGHRTPADGAQPAAPAPTPPLPPVTVAAVPAVGAPADPALVAELEAALTFAEQQTSRLYARLPELESPQDEAYPEGVPWGTRTYRMLTAGQWAAGFFPATLWALYELTGRAEWKRRAEAKTLGLWGEVVWDYGSNIGYKMLAFREGHRLVGDPGLVSFVMRGAETYVRGFGAELCVGSIPTWNPGVRKVNGEPLRHGVHTGGLMNIETLFWAAAQPGGERRWHDIAWQHAKNAVRDQLRPDGGAFHIVEYHPGCPPRGWRWRGTDSGKADGTKSRPQALAIHGLHAAYRYTADPALLDGAARAARFMLDPAHATADGVPYTDLLYGPVSREARDSSAAALAASAFLDLAVEPQLPAGQRAQLRAAAERLLHALSTRYLARNQDEGVLGLGPDPLADQLRPSLSPPIGDFAFLDAIRKYLGPGIHCRGPACELEAEAGALTGLSVLEGPPLAIARPAMDGPGPGGRAVYRVRTPRGGRYRLQLRLEATAPSTLSVDVGPRQALVRRWSPGATRGFEPREVPGEIALAPGAHEIAIGEVTAGVRVDKVILVEVGQRGADAGARRRRQSP